MSTNDQIDTIISIVTSMRNEYNKIAASTNPQKQIIIAKITHWINSIYGAIHGYTAEFESTMKHVIRKSRPLHEGKKGDVATGTRQDSKVTQFKSTIQDDRTVVSAQIAEAANQISGERGESPILDEPGKGDRPIIDIIINNARNYWPMYNMEGPRGTPECMKYYHKSTPSEDISKAAEFELKKVLELYTPHIVNSQGRNTQKGKGLSPAFIRWMTDLRDAKFFGGTLIPTGESKSILPDPRKNSTYAKVLTRANSELHINALIVKIRYKQGLKATLTDVGDSQGKILLLVLCVYKYGANLRVCVLKLRASMGNDNEEEDLWYSPKIKP